MPVEVAGIQITLVQLDKTTINIVDASKAALEAGGEEMFRQIRKHVSRRDHTLQDLARKGHPYARRHGAIQTRALGGAFVKRPWLVHKQSGDMLKAMRGFATHAHGGPPGYQVDFYGPNLEGQQHAENVILGTKVMLPRDPLWEAVQEKSMRTAVYRAIVKRLGKELRSKVGIRFGPGRMRTIDTPTREEGIPHTTVAG